MAVSPSAPRRRWPRFRLRTLLLLVVIIAIPLGWNVNRARDERRVVSELEKLSARILYDYQVPQINGVYRFSQTARPPGPEWLRNSLGQEYFVDVVQAMIDGPGPDGRFADNDTLAQLAKLPKLKWLVVRGDGMTDAGMAHLAGMSELVELGVLSENIAGPGYDQLAVIKGLKKLHLGARVTDGVLEHVAKLKQLESLDLWQADEVTDAGFARIATLPRLRTLSIASSPLVTEAGVAKLAALDHLEELELKTIRVSRAAIDKLQGQLPNCKIVWNSDGPIGPEPVVLESQSPDED
jgi:hypothetical protein